MRSKTTRRFRELLAALPEPAQRQAQVVYGLFRDNPAHPGLRFKRISPSDPPLYSVRVGLHYRAVGVLRGDQVLWVWIGSHADFDRVIEQH